MHFALAREHLDFFYQHHYIEFEDLLTEAEVESLSRALQETLAKRLHSKRETLAKTDLKTLYLSGYDMWRDNPLIQKFVLRPQLMIVYVEEKGIYAYQETDLHTHAFKKLGYGFGDRLRNATHPILYSG